MDPGQRGFYYRGRGDTTIAIISPSVRALRNSVRAAAFPRGILDAEDAPAAYEWANRQFGGDLLPPKGHADYNKTLAKFQYVRRLYR